MAALPEVLCDMDGVLADFHTAAALAHGVSLCRESYPPKTFLASFLRCGDYNKPEGFRRFWTPINAHPDFWDEVKPFPWWKDLIRFLELTYGEDNVSICTGPASGKPEELAGKARWLARYGIKHRLIMAKEKWRLSYPGVLLIDDWEKQVTDFVTLRDPGGEAVLFPQPWNSLHLCYEDPVAHIRTFCERQLASHRFATMSH